MKRRRLILSVLVALSAAALPALGWGDAGHRIIGEIAWQQLDQPTRDRVQALMPDKRFRTLYRTCTWADAFARKSADYEWLAPYHFVNIQPDAETYVAARDCADRVCVVAGIEIFAHRLANRDAPTEDLVLSLRVLSHLVGDLHQPLHAAHVDGRGGTRTRVRFQGEERTLHELWDVLLVEAAIADAEPRQNRRGWRSLADELVDEIDSRHRRRWSDLDPQSWAGESLRQARRYTYPAEDRSRVDSEAITALVPLVRRRLKQAGVRLAALLARIVDGEPLPFADPAPDGVIPVRDR